jgi:hypothetical protein
MDRRYRNKLRYLVARYAAFPSVFSWEFWNEVDQVRDYRAETVRDWHARMGDALRKLDPYGHLLTTSEADPMGSRKLDLISQLDYVQTHVYGDPDLVASVAYQQARKESWGRPHVIAEVGADTADAHGEDDPDGPQFHDPIWASIATGASGAALAAHWADYGAPRKLESLFGAVRPFLEGIDFPAEDFRATDVTLAYADAANAHGAPPLNAWALTGRQTVIAWFRVQGRSWQAVCAKHRTFAPCPETVVGIPGLARGPWTAEIWDTWTGRLVASSKVTVGLDGKARVSLPAVTKDIAVRMRKTP